MLRRFALCALGEKEMIRSAVAEGYYLAISDFIRSAVRNLLATAVMEPTYLETLINNENGELNEKKTNLINLVHACYRTTATDNREINYHVKRETFKNQSTLMRCAVRDEIETYKRRKEINHRRKLQEL